MKGKTKPNHLNGFKGIPVSRRSGLWGFHRMSDNLIWPLKQSYLICNASLALADSVASDMH